MRADRYAPLMPNAWLRYDVIAALLPPVPDGRRPRLLEIGCGQGGLAARLAGRYDYLGLEPDPGSYAVAARRLAETGSGEVRNVAVADLTESGFDVVCAFEVLEHLDDDAAAVRAWAAKLRPGGHLLLSVPAGPHRYGPFDELVGHYRRYDRAGIAAVLRGAGLVDPVARQYGMPLGYVLETGRNTVARRRLARVAQQSAQTRTAGSGRLLQATGGLAGTATRWGTAPFRLVQRAFPGTGTGLVARAARPA